MKKVLIIVVIIVIAAAGAWGIRKYMRSQTAPMTPAPTPTAATSDKQQIQTVLEQQVPQRGGVQKFQIIELKFQGDYARATIKPIDVVTDNATVYLQKKNGTWTIIWGPGTGADPNDPALKTVPQQLLQ